MKFKATCFHVENNTNYLVRQTFHKQSLLRRSDSEKTVKMIKGLSTVMSKEPFFCAVFLDDQNKFHKVVL